MEIYNTLSEKYDSLFLSTLEQFIKEIKDTKYLEKDYVTFYPSFGVRNNINPEFIFYGQAVNGWGSWLTPAPQINNVIEAKQYSNKFPVNTNFTPLDWVNIIWNKEEYDFYFKNNSEAVKFFINDNEETNYKTYRSFFWNVVFKTISDYYHLNRGSTEWTKKLVWSNLYKIAPDGANPDEFEKESQIDNSVELFRQELIELKPKFVILLTNESWWIPFKERLNTLSHKVPAQLNFITNYESIGNTKIIVTTRPRFGNGESHVKQILEVINQL